MIDPEDIDLQQFLISWHGPPVTPVAHLSSMYDWLPLPLQEWLDLSSHWAKPLVTVKRFVAPDKISRSDRKAIFMRDPTGDWMWAFDTQDGVSVYDAELHQDWKIGPEKLREFLVHNAMNETTYGASSWRECAQVAEDSLGDILAPMTEISFGGWRWPRPGVRTYFSNNLIAEVGPAMNPNAPWEDKPGYSEIRVAARSPEHLFYLDGIPIIKWIGSR